MAWLDHERSCALERFLVAQIFCHKVRNETAVLLCGVAGVSANMKLVSSRDRLRKGVTCFQVACLREGSAAVLLFASLWRGNQSIDNKFHKIGNAYVGFIASMRSLVDVEVRLLLEGLKAVSNGTNELFLFIF